MLRALFASDGTVSPLILRLALGAMIFPHGAQKLLGWFGGYGYAGTMQHFTENMNIPYIFALAAVLAEFFGGVGLILGLATRLSAALVGFTLAVGAAMSHLQHGFFMNWSGQQAGEGFEFHLLAVAMAAALAITGSGRWGLDRLIAEQWR